MASRSPRRGARRRRRPTRSLAAREPQLTVALREACATLDSLGVQYALVGGLAVSARAEPRLTRDVDVAVSVPDDAAAEQLVRELTAKRYVLEATVEQTHSGRLATARFSAPGSELIVDLLFASCGIEPEIVSSAELVEILPGLSVPVARSGHLVAMKLLSHDDRERPQDMDDLRALLPTLDAGELARVRKALTTIADRGYARGRDLMTAWQQLRRPAPKRPDRRKAK